MDGTHGGAQLRGRTGHRSSAKKLSMCETARRLVSVDRNPRDRASVYGERLQKDGLLARGRRCLRSARKDRPDGIGITRC
jgi:hypothetical protein